MARRPAWSALVAVGAVALACACTGRSGAASDEPEPGSAGDEAALVLSDSEQHAIGLTVDDVTEEALPAVHTRFGRVLARTGDEAVLVAPVTVRIIGITSAPIGTAVAEDTVLITAVPIVGAADSVALASAAAELSGQLRTAEEELTLRQATLERVRALSTTAVVSSQAVDEAATSVDTTQSQVDALRRATSIRARGGRTLALLAPRAGTLVAVDAVLGSVVQPGDVLARVVAAGARWVDIEVPTDEPTGTSYEIERDGEWAPATLLARGGTALGLVRRDRLTVDSTVDLVPGAEVTVRVAGERIVGPVVPETALVPLSDGEAVYVEREPGTYEARPVRVAARFGGRARIADGLREHERVVTRGAMALSGQALRALLGDAD